MSSAVVGVALRSGESRRVGVGWCLSATAFTTSPVVSLIRRCLLVPWNQTPKHRLTGQFFAVSVVVRSPSGHVLAFAKVNSVPDIGLVFIILVRSFEEGGGPKVLSYGCSFAA